MFRVLSWGCGLQSTTLATMSALGEIEPLDAILTADTGWERQVTYDIRDWYVDWLRKHAPHIHIEVLKSGDIRENGALEHVHIPFFTDSGAPMRRQCTRYFKLIPIKRRIRELLGYDARLAPHPPANSAEVWLGITLDEWHRAQPSRIRFMRNRFPLLEKRWQREICRLWLEQHDLPVPPKSACVCCPFRRAGEWLEMRRDAPDEWRAAIAFDEKNRHNPLAERDGSTSDELYIWSGRAGPEPLADADLEREAAADQRVYGVQLPFCDSGYCDT